MRRIHEHCEKNWNRSFCSVGMFFACFSAAATSFCMPFASFCSIGMLLQDFRMFYRCSDNFACFCKLLRRRHISHAVRMLVRSCDKFLHAFAYSFASFCGVGMFLQAFCMLFCSGDQFSRTFTSFAASARFSRAVHVLFRSGDNFCGVCELLQHRHVSACFLHAFLQR